MREYTYSFYYYFFKKNSLTVVKSLMIVQWKWKNILIYNHFWAQTHRGSKLCKYLWVKVVAERICEDCCCCTKIHIYGLSPRRHSWYRQPNNTGENIILLGKVSFQGVQGDAFYCWGQIHRQLSSCQDQDVKCIHFQKCSSKYSMISFHIIAV